MNVANITRKNIALLARNFTDCKVKLTKIDDGMYDIDFPKIKVEGESRYKITPVLSFEEGVSGFMVDGVDSKFGEPAWGSYKPAKTYRQMKSQVERMFKDLMLGDCENILNFIDALERMIEGEPEVKLPRSVTMVKPQDLNDHSLLLAAHQEGISNKVYLQAFGMHDDGKVIRKAVRKELADLLSGKYKVKLAPNYAKKAKTHYEYVGHVK